MMQITKTSGNTSWYTPSMYVEAARKVMGGIDLDPASCAEANKIVKADTWYGIEQNGLLQGWQGRVYCNPPYSRRDIGRFIDKLAFHSERGDVSAAIFLVNSACDTGWFHELLRISDAVCFTRGRIAFIRPGGESKGKPVTGQSFFYAGGNPDRFVEVFTQFGTVVRL